MPCSKKFCVSFFIFCIEIPFSCKKAKFPPKYIFPLILPLTPLPEILLKSSTFNNWIFFCSTSSKIASAKGCSEFCSKLPAICNKSTASPSQTKSITFGFPSVIVPVLSSTTVFTKCNNSRLSADLIKIPFSADFPVPTIIATGVAKPKAHGHEITRTAILILKANSKLWPCSNQTIPAKTAIVITQGTKIPLTLSANLAIGALEFPASSTNLIICERVVFSPTLVAFILKEPFLLIVPEITESPTVFSTGTLSPVMLAWSTHELPSTITPSTGIPLPGLITTISPIKISPCIDFYFLVVS